MSVHAKRTGPLETAKTSGYRSVRAAAHELGLAELTVRRAIGAGRIPAVQINGNWRIPGSYFDELERVAYSRFNETAPAPLPRHDKPGRPRQTPRVQWREIGQPAALGV